MRRSLSDTSPARFIFFTISFFTLSVKRAAVPVRLLSTVNSRRHIGTALPQEQFGNLSGQHIEQAFMLFLSPFRESLVESFHVFVVMLGFKYVFPLLVVSFIHKGHRSTMQYGAQASIYCSRRQILPSYATDRNGRQLTNTHP